MTAVEVEPSTLRKPWITEPGVYDLDEASYHRDPVLRGSLSSTGARALATRTPAHFDYDRRYGRADKAVFDYGRAAHQHVLSAGMAVAVVDAGDWRTKAAREQRDAARAEGKTPLLVADFEKVEEMAGAIRRHPVAGPMMARPGRAEQVMVYRDPATDVMCRVMADWMPDVPSGRPLQLVDYKSTTNAEPEAFAKSAATYGYDVQHAFYVDAPVQLDMAGEHEPVFLFLAQEKTPPYLCSLVQLDEEAVERGRWLARKARRLFRDCTASGVWPGYSDRPVTVSLPGYALKDYRDAVDSGELYDEGDPA